MYVIINLYLLQCQGGCPIQILGSFSNLVGKLYPFPFSLTFRQINKVKQKEDLKNLTLQIVVLDDDNCSSVSKAKDLLINQDYTGVCGAEEGMQGCAGIPASGCIILPTWKPTWRVLV